MDKQATLNKVEQLINLIDQKIIPLTSESDKAEELSRDVLLLKGYALQIRQQIRKA